MDPGRPDKGRGNASSANDAFHHSKKRRSLPAAPAARQQVDNTAPSSLRLLQLSSNSLPVAIKPFQLVNSRIVQRVIPGLEEINSIALIPDGWAAAYLNDVRTSPSFLYDEDIIRCLNRVDPGWDEHVKLTNTGGNHWDVVIKKGETTTVVVQTVADGNCGIHALHAVAKRDKIDKNEVEHRAPQAMIDFYRGRIADTLATDQNEIKTRILLEIQRNNLVNQTGFGPQLQTLLQAHVRSHQRDLPASDPRPAQSSGPALGLPVVNLRKYRRFERLLNEKFPLKEVRALMVESGIGEKEADDFLKSYSEKDPEKKVPEKDKPGTAEVTREKVLALEEDLMNMVDFEEDERQFLKDIQTHLKGQSKALEAAAQPGYEKEIANLKEQWKQYKERSAGARASNAKRLTGISELRTKWMELMEELCGTHFVQHSGGGSGNKGLVKRHDAAPGVYGKAPDEQGEQIAHSQVEVLHGHGGWERTGLLSTGILSDEMPGLTSLNEIIERANLIRRSKKLLDLQPDKIDLAFVDDHGSTIMMGKVIKGAYPDLMPIPLKLHREVLENLEKAKEQSMASDDYFDKLCRQAIVDPGKKKYAEKKGEKYIPDYTTTNKELLDAYQRVKTGTESGKPAQYVDIIEAERHGNVKFPDSKLGHLMGLDAGEKAMKAAAKAIPNYKVSTLLDFEGFDRNTVTIGLSAAVTERLAALRDVDKPVRIVWAACRSEQFPRGFSDQQFLEWIKEAAAKRRAAGNR